MKKPSTSGLVCESCGRLVVLQHQGGGMMKMNGDEFEKVADTLSLHIAEDFADGIRWNEDEYKRTVETDEWQGVLGVADIAGIREAGYFRIAIVPATASPSPIAVAPRVRLVAYSCIINLAPGKGYVTMAMVLTADGKWVDATPEILKNGGLPHGMKIIGTTDQLTPELLMGNRASSN